MWDEDASPWSSRTWRPLPAHSRAARRTPAPCTSNGRSTFGAYPREPQPAYAHALIEEPAGRWVVYGTVARMKIQQEKFDELRALMEDIGARSVPGFRG